MLGRNQRAFDRLSAAVEAPMAVLTVVWLPVLIVPLAMAVHGEVAAAFAAIDYTAWALFGVECGPARGGGRGALRADSIFSIGHSPKIAARASATVRDADARRAEVLSRGLSTTSKGNRHMRKTFRTFAAIGASAGLSFGVLAATAGPASADYGPGAKYQVEISGNSGTDGVWLWAALTPSSTNPNAGTGDYEETDCIHLSRVGVPFDAAGNAGGTLNWSISGGVLTMTGIEFAGGQTSATFTVGLPQGTYGHEAAPVNVSFSPWLDGLPGVFFGAAQVQIAP